MWYFSSTLIGFTSYCFDCLFSLFVPRFRKHLRWCDQCHKYKFSSEFGTSTIFRDEVTPILVHCDPYQIFSNVVYILIARSGLLLFPSVIVLAMEKY